MITFYKYAIRELALFNARSILARRVLLKSYPSNPPQIPVPPIAVSRIHTIYSFTMVINIKYYIALYNSV